ncbi:flagellar basal body protein [Legionella pneumophila]|nr:flagellar basal body protein [Legionella pneumophila]
MEPALWVSKSGLEAQDKNIATIANNLANVNTTAFKKGRALFEDLIYQNLRQAGAQSSQNSQIPTGINMGTGCIWLLQKKYSARAVFRIHKMRWMLLSKDEAFLQS